VTLAREACTKVAHRCKRGLLAVMSRRAGRHVVPRL